MEHLWSPAGATGGNRWQMRHPQKPVKQADQQPVATHGNRFGAHGKEHVCHRLPPVADDPLFVREEVDLGPAEKGSSPANPKAHRTRVRRLTICQARPESLILLQTLARRPWNTAAGEHLHAGGSGLLHELELGDERDVLGKRRLTTRKWVIPADPELVARDHGSK